MSMLNIIPTPQSVVAIPKTGKTPLEKAKTFFVDAALKKSAAEAFKFLPLLENENANKADVVITCDASLAKQFYAVDEDWFKHPNAEEQGYIIKGLSNGKIVIFAHNYMGIMYAIATLIQIPAVSDEFEIKDYPDFRYRGNKWLIWNETEVWSYDFGDGIDAFKERIIRKLDMCLKFKINMVYFDGWGSNLDRTPHYKELMNLCNHEARKRGIHLIHGAYTMGYGLSAHNFGKHFGKVYKNINAGEEYECLGTFKKDPYDDSIEPFVTGRTFGTCISNKELMEDKLSELKEFIREAQPGALYLHNMDSHVIDQRLWLARCEDCRKRWPNDDVLAKDGMAGAFAEFFDELNGGLRSVKCDDYDASKDLLIFNVSPGYMWYVCTDEEIESASKFWEAVQKYTKVKENVIPLFRELHYNRDDDKLRIPDVVSKAWQGEQSFGIINFSGAGGFYNDKLFFISSVFNYMFKGADALITCSGSAFQEPLQIFNAEYMWKCENSSFYNMKDVPVGYDAFLKLYYDCRDTKVRPHEVYGDGGMLDVICQKLYGENWEAMSKVFKLCGENFECVVPYACNKETLNAGNDVIIYYRWDNELPETEIEKFIASFGEIKRLNELAESILKAEKTDNPDIKSYLEMILLNKPIVCYWYEYLKLYLAADQFIKNGVGEKEKLIEQTAALREKVLGEKSQHNARNFDTVDAMLGALARREEMLDVQEYNLSLIIQSLETNKRIPDNRKILHKEIWW